MTTNSYLPAPTAKTGDDQPRGVTTAPPADILETDDGFRLLLDLPGVQPGDVDVRFEDGELAVNARRTTRTGGLSFARTFRVSERIAADKITADLKNGVLTLTLPKVEAVRPRRIAVQG
jgi:HSP20 family protein